MPEWSKQAVAAAIRAGWLTGADERVIGGERAASRAQAAVAIGRIIQDAEREMEQDGNW